MEDQVVQPDLTLTTEKAGTRAVVGINGELDAYGTPKLEAEVAQLVTDGITDLVFDLANTGFLDSSGLRAILCAQTAITDHGGHFALRSPSDSVRRLLDITGLTHQFDGEA